MSTQHRLPVADPEMGSPFRDYIDNIVTELLSLPADPGRRFNVHESIVNLERLAEFSQQYSLSELPHTYRLLSVDSGLYSDLIYPLLAKRLAI